MRYLLDRLPDAEAVPLRLRFYRGMTQVEIAELTRVPLGTVKSRMGSGLGRLRMMIEEDEAQVA